MSWEGGWVQQHLNHRENMFCHLDQHIHQDVFDQKLATNKPNLARRKHHIVLWLRFSFGGGEWRDGPVPCFTFTSCNTKKIIRSDWWVLSSQVRPNMFWYHYAFPKSPNVPQLRKGRRLWMNLKGGGFLSAWQTQPSSYWRKSISHSTWPRLNRSNHQWPCRVWSMISKMREKLLG